ncbi:MAG: M1 family metallopeptidase [Chitinophagaceae bacterium]
MKKHAFIVIALICFLKLQAQNETLEIAKAEQKANAKKFDANLLSRASPNFTVYYYRCEWNIDPSMRYISGKVTSYFKITSSTNRIVFDLTNQLIVDSIYWHNRKINFNQTSNETLSVHFPLFYSINKKDSISIFYHGSPAGGGFGSFVQTTHNNVPIIWTLSEPYGAKDWWPCRNGLDDKADSIDIFISHPFNYNASSNGILESKITKNGITISHYKHRYPIASYLVAIAVTNYSIFTKHVQLNNVFLPVISYIYPENLSVFENNNYIVMRALKLYNETFTNYPFLNERYGQTQFSWGGGMEHQTNSFVVSTDENLMTHELSHQWFGDKITCGSWRDIWLNEGFATYIADIFYTEKFHPALAKTNIANDLNYIVSQPGGSVWVDDTTNVNRIFDGRLTYDKGAFLLRMLRWTLGDSIFFKALREYQNDPKLAYNFAFTKDLQQHFEQASGTNLNYFFKQWFYGQGYPSFTVNWLQVDRETINLTISQATSAPSSVDFFRVPLALTFKNATQQKTIVVNNHINNQKVTVQIGFVADTVLIDPDKQLISSSNKSVQIYPSIAHENIQFYPNPVTDELNVFLHDISARSFIIESQKIFSNTSDQTTINGYFFRKIKNEN